MRKYMKQLALSVVTLCMIFTLASGNVVNAATTKPGKKVWIYYAGVNLGLNDFFFNQSLSLCNSKVLSKSDKDILINPTSNLNSFDKGKYLNGLYSVEQKKDEFGNKYNDLVTEQVVNVNGEYKTFQLVGYKSVTSIPTTVMDYLNEFGQLKFEDFEKLTDEEKKQYIDFEYGEYIDINTWNATKKSNSTRMDLASVYAEKTTPPIEFGKGEYDYNHKTTKWKTNRKELKETTDGITTDVDYDKKEITFTIPETYEGEDIQLTLDNELVELFAFRFKSLGGEIVDELDKPGWDKNNEYIDIEPGDVMNFKINIVNNSKYDYGYLNNSLILTTPTLNTYYDSGYTEKTSTEMYGFDGQRLMQKFTPTRIPNEALVALAGKNEVLNVMKDDKKLGELLDKLYCTDGEKEGIKNLNKYYIDYYNNKYKNLMEPKTKIEDFGNEKILELFEDPLQSFMNSHETNKEVAETLYNYFYNAVLGVAPAKDLPKVNSNKAGDSILNQKYTLGNYMRKGNSSFEDFMNEQLGVIQSKEIDKSVTWGYQIDGPKCFNIYNFMDYGFEMGFKLEKKVGDVTVDKHIELGGFDKNNTPTFMFKLTDSKGVEYFKTISFNEGETDKQVVFKDIPYGKYTVEEIDSIRYEVLGQPVLEGVLDDVKQSGYVQYVNTKVKDNDFSDTNLVINSFKKGDNSIEISKKEHNNGKRG